MRRKSSFVLLFFILVVIFALIVPDEDGEYLWNPFDYARITGLDYWAVVVDEPGSDGKVVITERVTFDVHAMSRNNLFWELWRDLPEEYVDGVKIDYRVNSVRQVFEDGSYVTFLESPKLYWDDNDFIDTAGGLGPGRWFHSKGPYSEALRQYECLLIYVDGIYRETVVFEIEYEMYNAALRYADSSELYLSLYDDSSIRHLRSVRGQILVPIDKMPRPGNYDAHTFGTNSHGFYFTESTSINPGYHTFAFTLGESQLRFRPYNRYVEFALIAHGEDRHSFTQFASMNIHFNDNMLPMIRHELTSYAALPGQFAIAKVIVLISLSTLALLAILLAHALIKNAKRKHTFYQPEMQIEFFRDIPSEQDPVFASALAFCKHKSSSNINDGYSSVMLSLVQKEYIEISKMNPRGGWHSGNMKIVVKHKPMPAPDLDDNSIEQQIMQEEGGSMKLKQ